MGVAVSIKKAIIISEGGNTENGPSRYNSSNVEEHKNGDKNDRKTALFISKQDPHTNKHHGIQDE